MDDAASLIPPGTVWVVCALHYDVPSDVVRYFNDKASAEKWLAQVNSYHALQPRVTVMVKPSDPLDASDHRQWLQERWERDHPAGASSDAYAFELQEVPGGHS